MRSLLLLALALLAAPAARADTTDCTPITSLPVTLSSPGVYCLTRDLTTSIGYGTAVSIEADDVTLDCNGYKIGGLEAGLETSALGVWARQQSNVTVRNCTVRGFQFGIRLDGLDDAPPLNLLVEDNRVEDIVIYGISVHGNASAVRRNIVTDVGGRPIGNTAVGIVVTDATSVMDNTIDGVAANGQRPEAAGIIRLAGSTNSNGNGGNIENNRVRRVQAEVGYGIYVDSGVLGVVVRDNAISASYGLGGVSCNTDYGPPGAVAVDNVAFGFAQPVVGCVDGGGNLRGNPEEG